MVERQPTPRSIQQMLEDALRLVKSSAASVSAGPVLGADGLALPPCPVCGKPAYAGQYTNPFDIAHDCNCCIDRSFQYDSLLVSTYNKSRAEHLFLKSPSLPDFYREHFYRAALRGKPENQKVSAYLRSCDWMLRENLFLYGPAGTGKSMLAVSVARHMASQGKTAKYWNMVALLDAIKDSIEEARRRPYLEGYDVLVLDDVDKLRATEYAYERLYSILEQRWSSGKVTIFTAQFNPGEAALLLTPGNREERVRAADPLASRMGCGSVFEIGGRDQRAGRHG